MKYVFFVIALCGLFALPAHAMLVGPGFDFRRSSYDDYHEIEEGDFRALERLKQVAPADELSAECLVNAYKALKDNWVLVAALKESRVVHSYAPREIWDWYHLGHVVAVRELLKNNKGVAGVLLPNEEIKCVMRLKYACAYGWDALVGRMVYWCQMQDNEVQRMVAAGKKIVYLPELIDWKGDE